MFLKRLIIISSSSILLLSLTAKVYAESNANLSFQLQQAVESKEWTKAIQILDKMIIANPSQSKKLNAYRKRLIEHRNSSIIVPSSSVNNEERKLPKNTANKGTVSITEARIQSDSYGSAGNLTYLSGKIYNSTDSTASNIIVYYDIVSWNKDNNTSGVILISLMGSKREIEFKEKIAEPTKPKQFESARVRINKIEWLDGINRYRSNTNKRLFGYWGK